jgi:hypothetical protein
MKLRDRVTFRATLDDARHIEALGETLRTASGTAFVSRSEVLRMALRVAAEASAKGAPKVPGTPAAVR